MSNFSTIILAILATAFVYFLVGLLTYVVGSHMNAEVKIRKKVKRLLKILGIIYFFPIVLALISLVYFPIAFAFILLTIFFSTYPSYRLSMKYILSNKDDYNNPYC